ncbi:MAG: SDR family NAD(P)-dependent oxidoreductase [Acidimicrobiales bacterium]
MDKELAGKVAVVTGGANGIGLAMVELFVEEGAQVVIADLDVAAGEEVAARLGDAAAFKQTDVADAERVQELVDFTVARFGGLHVMVNNAGISSSFRRFIKDDLRDFQSVMAVDLYGVMVGSQRAARHMADHGGGSIVNTTSIAGIIPGVGLTTYRAAKAGVIHFSRSIAIELAEHGIRVNVIAPGNIATSINAALDTAGIIRRLQPLQRAGKPTDVANAALYLASERSAQVTGVVLPVDGGTSTGTPAGQVGNVMAAEAAAPTKQ